MSAKPTLLLIGSGPGIGISIGTLFAQKRFKRIALISRSSSRLEQNRQIILDAVSSVGDVEVTIWAVDVTITSEFAKTLNHIQKWANGNIECVIYNAARVGFSTLTKFEESEMINDFKLTNTALHNAFAWALPLLKIHTSASPTEGRGSFLVTSSLLWKTPIPEMFSLSLTKAAQRSLVTSLHMTYPELHITLLNVKGSVSKDSSEFSPELVAAKW